MKRLLHIGCGPQDRSALYGFSGPAWTETRLDIDPAVHPDILASMTDLGGIPSASFDALYSSHSIEHVYPHEVPGILAELARLLVDDGFVVITCPDLQSVCAQVAQGHLIEPLYQSGMGPIAAIDILYGHRASIASGNTFMAHRGGFTSASLSAALTAAGFRTSVVMQRPAHYDLWAIAWKTNSPRDWAVQQAAPYFPPDSLQPAPQPASRQDELDARYVRGLELIGNNQHEDTLAYYAEALLHARDPGTQAYLLGYQANALNRLGRTDEALALTEKAMQLDPTPFSVLFSRACAYALRHDAQKCLDCTNQGLALYPDRIELQHNQAAALADLRRNEESLAASEVTIARHPDDARSLYNSAVILDRLGRFDESLDRYKRALALRPDEPWGLGALLTAKLRAFDWSALDSLVHAIADGIAQGKPVIEPFRFLCACADPQQQLDAARVLVQKYHLQSLQSTTFDLPRMPHARLRVGYFSSDFRNHPVMELAAEVFELHDRERFEVHAFSLVDAPADPVQARAREAFEHFHDISGLSAEETVALARRLQIDLAIDLNGHTRDARPAMLSLRVAPVQIAWLGYPASTGARYMDYIVADNVVIPPSHRGFYTEKVLSLPGSFQPGDRKPTQPAPPPPRKALGLPEHGFVYACFNAPMKLQPAMFDRWVAILKAVEGSVLWVYDNGRESARHHLRQEAEARGLDPQRLVFAPWLPLAEHLARHTCADLFLDTLPFNAGATASCALRCGLPVLTTPGDTFASRYGASLLTALGLPELIAPSPDAYQATAIEWGRNPEALRPIKHKLQRALQASTLFDTPRFVRHLEAAYHAAWERHQGGLPPDHIEIPA